MDDRDLRIAEWFLNTNNNCVFVYGDNTLRKGKGGAAILRDVYNTFGVITKKFPNNDDRSFYRPKEYEKIFEEELAKLEKAIQSCPDKIFLISRLGAGLANKHKIWEKIIYPNMHRLRRYNNVVFLFNWSQ